MKIETKIPFLYRDLNSKAILIKDPKGKELFQQKQKMMQMEKEIEQLKSALQQLLEKKDK